MLSNYLVTALQGLKNNLSVTALKIFSLSIGLASSILVIMDVQYTYSFDKHFPNWENTYRLVTSITLNQTRRDLPITSNAYAPALELYYDQIGYIAKISGSNSIFSRGNDVSSNSFYYADPEIINIFSLEFISGDPETALNAPNAVVLTEKTAEKYFFEENPIGQTLTMADKVDLQVTGVMRDLPENTHIDIEMLISVEAGRQINGENFMANSSWTSFQRTFTYLTIPNKDDAEFIRRDLINFVEKNIPDQQRVFSGQLELALFLEPLSKVYLSPRGSGRGSNSNRVQILTGLSIFAFLILVSSCINYSNLSLSQIQQRRKEVGVRKTLGANKYQILFQFLFESLLLTFIALAFASLIIEFMTPVYKNLTGSGFNISSIFKTRSVSTLIGFVIFTGLISGLLPAIALSRLEPALIIKGENRHRKLPIITRFLVTVIQFSVSITLIILTLAISLQIKYLNSMEPGFDKNNLVLLNIPRSLDFNNNALINEINEHPGIVSVAMSNTLPPSTGPVGPWRLPRYGADEFITLNNIIVDTNYTDTLRLQIIAGRKFSEDYATDFIQEESDSDLITSGGDSARAVLITRDASKIFGFDSPEEALGEVILTDGNQYRVIGVLENFRLRGGLEDSSVSTSILRGSLGSLRYILIRLDPQLLTGALEHIDTVWSKHLPNVPIDRDFYEQIFADIVFQRTNGISKASVFAAGITVLISVLGLYALSIYSGQRRIKEIGIRKVLGATLKSIIGVLAWDFLKPVLVACIVALGTGYIAAAVYLQQFSSSVEMPLLLYVFVILFTMLVGLITIASQCHKAANSDPIVSLRYE